MDRIALNTRVFPGMPRWLSSVLWMCALVLLVRFMWWAVPHVPIYFNTLCFLTIVCFFLTIWRGKYGLFVAVFAIPWITTIAATIFKGTEGLGITGLTALYPVAAYSLGIWASSILKKEDAAPLPIRPLIGLFLLCTYIAAGITLWRYIDLWPLHGWEYPWDTIVNVEGKTATFARIKIYITLMNYTVGPLFLLTIVQNAWRDTQQQKISSIHWILRQCILPLFIGAIFPMIVGIRQIEDVWYGANKFYVWPWMNRINATFFDPNALGAFMVLFIPWVLAFLGWMLHHVRKKTLCFVSGTFISMLFIALACVLYVYAGKVSDTSLLYEIAGSRLRILLVFLAIWLICLLGIPMILTYIIKRFRQWGKQYLYLIYAFTICTMSIITGCFLVIHAGSRTGLLGISFGAWVLCVILSVRGVYALCRNYRQSVRRICVVLVVLFYIFSVSAVIYESPRIITWARAHPVLSQLTIIKRFQNKAIDSFSDLYRLVQADRGPYVKLAWEIIQYVPVTGIGPGTFVTEFPNWKNYIDQIIYVPDTACNYYLQVASEQGVPVLILVLCIFYMWWKRWWYVYTHSEYTWYWQCIGAGMAGMLMVFFFGMHTLAHEIQCFFWLYAAQPFLVFPKQKARQWKSIYVWIPILALFGVLLARAMTDLSLEHVRQMHGWEKRKGFYQEEHWQDANLYITHTRANAIESIKCTGIVCKQKFACLHPDITNRPVKVTYEFGAFRTNMTIKTPEWHEIVIPFHYSNINSLVTFHIAVDRTWNPREIGIDDSREIGVTLQRPVWYKTEGTYADEKWPKDKSIMSQKAYFWTKNKSRILLDQNSTYVQMPLLIAHPDNTSTPVHVRMRINDGPWTTITHEMNGWQYATCFRGKKAASDLQESAVLCVEVERTWQPSKHGGNDARELGCAIGPRTYHDTIGLSKLEVWQNDFTYRWANESAQWPVELSKSGHAKTRYLVSHPDIERNPVEFTVWTNSVKAFTRTHSAGGWYEMELTGSPDSVINCKAKVSRTWCPRHFGQTDPRHLGFAVEIE